MLLNEILSDIESRYKDLLGQMKISDVRKQHLDGCIELAYTLAGEYGIDQYKAVLAAILHDFYRDMNKESLLEIANSLNIRINSFEYKFPKVLHGKLAAEYFVQNNYLSDFEVLEAIRCHTLGEASVGNQTKLLFIVDALEKYRNYDGVEELRNEIIGKDLDQAYLLVLKRTIVDMMKKNKILAPATVGAYNHMVEVD